MKAQKKLTFTEYTAMATADLFKAVADIAVKPIEALDKATAKVVSNLKDAAKGVAALKRIYTERIEKREIPGDTAFKKFFKDNVGGELPGRVEALANLFNALVLTNDAKGNPLISEEIFDDEGTPVDWLEKASAIVNAAREKHGDAWKGCDEVLDMILALTKPGDAGKKLKEIRERQKSPKTEGETAEAASAKPEAGKERVSMTVALAAQFLIAAIKGAAELSDEKGAELMALTQSITDAWHESYVDEDKLNRWSDNVNNGVAPHLEVVK